MPKAKKMGRPKLPKGHAKGRIIPVRFSEKDLELLTEVFESNGRFKSVSDFLRYAVKETAKREKARAKRVS